MMRYGCYIKPDIYYLWMLRIDSSLIKDVIDNIIQLNGKIAECNLKSIKTCSKCDAIKRKYDYCIRELQDLRAYLKKQIEADDVYKDQTTENRYDIDSFMKKNYPTIHKKYKSSFGLFVKQDELSSMIEATGRFKITASKNVKYGNRK